MEGTNMYGLNATLSMASQALSAESGALAITNSNITNVNTPGYAREVVNLTSDAVLNGAGASETDGVSYSGYTSVRDEVLNLAIQDKTSDAGSLNTQSALWSQIESGFSSTTSGIGASLSNLFSSLSALSTEPSNAGARQAALSAANNLVGAFHEASGALTSAQSQADQTVSGIVANVNQLTVQIASLDQQLAASEAAGQDGGSVQDQRDQLTTQLAGLIGFASTSTQATTSLSTANGSPLVVGGKAYALEVTQGSDGKTHVLDAEGQDITASLSGGSLGGALVMRDRSIPQLAESLDVFASQFATTMNSAQSQGFDADANPGSAMFSLPTDGSSAAEGITLTLTDPSGLALSSDGSLGSSGNLANLLAVQADQLPGGQTPTNTYAGFVQSIGSSSANVSGNLTATNGALSQLTIQQQSESGVSIDEETTNLLRFQQAYTAAAKVVSVVNDLYSTLMNMGVTT
jgi:flagellar hook-associated protein 1